MGRGRVRAGMRTGVRVCAHPHAYPDTRHHRAVPERAPARRRLPRTHETEDVQRGTARSCTDLPQRRPDASACQTGVRRPCLEGVQEDRRLLDGLREGDGEGPAQ